MGLKLLCAGCSKDEKDVAEVSVREALGRKVEDGSWVVSLVRITDRWSITVDAPAHGLRGLALVAPQGRIRDTIAEALGGPASAMGTMGAMAAPAAVARGAHRCDGCSRSFVVVYDVHGDEGEESAPVACPHCWHVNHVLVGENAAETRDYRAEKA